MNEPTKPVKIHHCAICGEETEDYEYLPNNKKIYICGSNECAKDFMQTAREMESEARSNAQEDGYSKYY